MHVNLRLNLVANCDFFYYSDRTFFCAGIERSVMKNMMQYKGYYGSIEFDSAEPIFFGKVEFIKALISYEAHDAKGILAAFQEAIDDYLVMCESEGVEPEQPFKGSFNVRTGHELHQQIALVASEQKLTLNKFVCLVLQKAVKAGMRS